MKHCLQPAACVAAALLCATASAQTNPVTGFPVERLRISPDRSGLIDTEFGRVLPHLGFDVGLHLGYANDPLVVYRTADGQRLGSLVSDRLGGSLIGGLGLFDWLQLSLELPVVFYQAGQREIPDATSEPLAALRTLGLGDLRVIPKLRVLRSDQQAIDLAVQLSVLLPTGGGAQYFGDRGVVLAPELILSRAFGGLRLAGNLALSLLRGDQQVLNLSTGNELTARLGVGFRFHEHNPDWVPLELDLSASSATALSRPYGAANQQALELKGQAAWHFASRVVLFAGAGGGLGRGWGTPDFRAFAGVRFGSAPPVAAPKDRDRDGLLDADDRCPDAPETVNGFDDADGCPDDPDPDRDGVLGAADRCPQEAEDKDGFEDADGCPDLDDDRDGVPDTQDRCRLEPEDKDGFQDDDGCPDPDNDGDGILDGVDACPQNKGVPELRGCPDFDSDGDGVVDRLDNCPKEPGPASNQGCKEKQLVVITSEKLTILESVYFKTNRAVIESRSFPLLDNVAKILLSHEELEKVRIEGHTDSQGNDGDNLKLSQARSEAVRDYLVKKGVGSGRLAPLGFGEARPIADNKSAEGRAKNRRVEFNLGDEAPSDIKLRQGGTTP